MVNWKEIDTNFTEELQKEREAKGFSYEECKEWIDIGLGVSDSDYCSWLRGVKGVSSEWLLSYSDEQELREGYTNYLENKNSQSENEDKTSNIKSWKDIHS